MGSEGLWIEWSLFRWYFLLCFECFGLLSVGILFVGVLLCCWVLECWSDWTRRDCGLLSKWML